MLDNGLRVVISEDHSAPTAAVTVYYNVGNVNEGPEQVWLSDLLADLMLQGTDTRSSAEISAEAGRMGGERSINVSSDQTTFRTSVLSEFAPDAIRLMADVVQNPTLPEAKFERLKRDRVRQLSVSQSQPSSKALATFRFVLYGDDHAYGQVFPT